MKATLLTMLRPWIDDFVRRVELVPGNASVTSWLRTPARNAAVGGKPDSQHLVALAADFVPIAPTTKAQLVAGLRAQGLIAIDEGDHVHAQLFPAGTLTSLIDGARRSGLL